MHERNFIEALLNLGKAQRSRLLINKTLAIFSLPNPFRSWRKSRRQPIYR